MSELIPILGTRAPDRRGDVVFIHGLNGDPRATWQPEEQPDRFWPNWLGEDIASIGVWSLGYSVSSFGWKGSTMPLADRAVNALVLLETNSIGTEKPVVFIAHSLGGLLVKEMLRKATYGSVPEGEALAEHTRGVVFLSTPHSGSNLANFVSYLKFLLPTVSISELNTQEPRLRELNSWYRNNVQKLSIKTQVYCERKPTPAGRNWLGQLVSTIVVDASSADPGLAGVTAVPMDDDHITISRPERGGMLYKRIRGFVEEQFDQPLPSTQNAAASRRDEPPTSSEGDVAIGGNVVGGVIVTGDGNVIHMGEAPPDQQGHPGRDVLPDLQTLVNTLNRLLPVQLSQLFLILQVPPEIMPGTGALHGERVIALIQWSQSSTGAGLARIQEELDKILRSQ